MSPSRVPTERTRAVPPASETEVMSGSAEATAARTAATAAQVPARVRSGLTGTIGDRYTLSKRVGSGAFGSVWMARDERLNAT